MPIRIVEKKKKKMPSGPKPRPDYANPNHPMNRERTGPSNVLKEDPVYKKSGGKIYNCR